MTRRCAWCRLDEDNGNIWQGQWVCDTCFPEKTMKKIKEKPIPKQKPQNQPHQHKNKYAHFSQHDKHQGGGSYVKLQQSNPKPRRKEKKPKLKKITYWKVVITDISTGDL